MKQKLSFNQTCILTLFCILFSISSSAQDAKKQALDTFVKTAGISDGLVTLAVKTFDGKDVITFNKNLPLTPASTIKTLITATSLELLGKDFRFKTYIGKGNNANEIIIKGTGDPTLGTIFNNDGVRTNFSYQSSFLEVWKTQITNALASKTQPIKIILDDSYYGYQGVSKDWLYEDIGNYYGASTYGINVFDNSYNLELNSEDITKAPKIVSTFPNMSDLTFTNLLNYNTSGKDNAYIVGEPMSNQITLIGDIPQGKKSFIVKGAIPNPSLVLGQFVKTKLESNGVNVASVENSKKFYLDNRFTTDTIAFKSFFVHQSIPLSDICRIINVSSHNLFTESLIRRIGRFAEPSIYKDALSNGIEKVSTYWSAKGLNNKELSLSDGCGLAPTDAVSADYLTSALIYMQTKGSNAAPYLASFPKAGMEGTVKNVLANSKHKGFVYMKSGSISGVQAFAGYYINGDKKYAFSIIVNKYTCSRAQVVKSIEALLEAAFQ